MRSNRLEGSRARSLGSTTRCKSSHCFFPGGRAHAHTLPSTLRTTSPSQSVSLHSSAPVSTALFHIHSLAGNHLVKVTGDHIPNPLSTSSTDLTNACGVGHCRPAIPGAFPLLASRAMPLRVLVPAQPASLLARQQADLWERRLPFPTPPSPFKDNNVTQRPGRLS